MSIITAIELPKFHATGLRKDSNPTTIINVANAAVAYASEEVMQLLQKHNLWAYEALTKPHVASAAKLAALKCLDFCELELVRRQVRKSSLFEDWGPSLPVEERRAIEQTLRCGRELNWDQRRRIINAVKAMMRLDNEDTSVARPAMKVAPKGRSDRKRDRRDHDRELRMRMKGQKGQKPQKGQQS